MSKKSGKKSKRSQLDRLVTLDTISADGTSGALYFWQRHDSAELRIVQVALAELGVSHVVTYGKWV